jgi:two-component system alkaline phosphatase synthesis response regulator PhoP
MFLYDSLIDVISQLKCETLTKDEVIKIIKNHYLNNPYNEIESSGVKIIPSELRIIQGDKVDNPPKQIFKLIQYFMLNANKCLTRDNLLRNCWHSDVIVGDRTIDVHICKIKRLLKDKSILQTKKGYGYIWIEK